MKKVSLALSLICGLMLTAVASVNAADQEESPIFEQKMTSLDGKEVDLSQYKGKVLLIVNVASQCGATPQYEPLQGLHEKYADKGLAVLGFPCNQFGKQEPGDESEIAQFCEKNYGVTFDMFSKIEVNGEEQAPLYEYLTTSAADEGKVKWNFEKFLISKDGKVVERFRTKTQPDSEEVVTAIEAELAK
ncbi:Hydroperoxy fatty acid reductase gpx1 [Polystyrenella longa]|uniref:Glutathione peroxidase n=1 Tax=Polystyrenella longa TaxID=2528007 RepID=A0A518CJH6_9PLAN|nr:glutathione peroxidase [Polystyrenella longa]QDU79375.1 Hydroperoxy fatty acid reductase gpx1 [Polystyrenella longa]